MSATRWIATGLALCLGGPMAAQQQVPTLAVLDLNDGGSLGPDAQNLTGLGKGISAMLTTEMSRNPRVRMVERDRIRALLDEQRLAVSGVADESSAIRVGRLLGVQYMVFGSYSDVYGQLRMDLRVVEVETGRLVRAQELTAPRENLLTSVGLLADRTFRDLSLPATPRPVSAAPEQVPAAAAIAFSRGLAMEDAGDAAGARVHYQEAIRLAPGYAAATERLHRTTMAARSGGGAAPPSASSPAPAPPAAAEPAPSAPNAPVSSAPRRTAPSRPMSAPARRPAAGPMRLANGQLRPFESAAMLDADLPRVLVLVGSREDGASTEMGEFLRAGGFTVIDPAFARSAADRERLTRALAGSDPDAVDLGRSLGAHVLLVGTAPSDAAQGEPGLTTGTAEVSIRALRLDKAEVVASARASGRGVDATAGAARAKAIRAALEQVKNSAFVGQIMNDWRMQPWDQHAYWTPEPSSVAGQLSAAPTAGTAATPGALAIVEAASYPDTGSGRRGLGVVGRVPMRARVRGIVPSASAQVSVGGVAARVRPVTAEERARFGLSGEGVFFDGQAPLAPDQDTVRVRAQAGGSSAESLVRTAAGNRWAVVIGVSRYADAAIPALRYAEADARAMHAFLRSPRGGALPETRIRLLVNEQATTAAIRDALFTFLQQAGPDDQVTIYVATHGAPDPARPGNLYILSHDTDVRRMAATAFPMWDFQTAVRRQIAAQRVVVIADACHSAGTLVDEPSRLNEAWDVLFNPSMRMTLSAARGSEYSREGPQWGGGHGVFTHALLEGLGGAADADHDGVVTFTEAALWVERTVPGQTGGEQNPQRSGLGDVPMAWVAAR